MPRNNIAALFRKHAAAKLKPHTVQPAAPKPLSDMEWMAKNYEHTAEKLTMPHESAPPTDEEREDALSFRELFEMDADHGYYDKRTGVPTDRFGINRVEPKHILSPAGVVRLKFEQPRRKPGPARKVIY